MKTSIAIVITLIIVLMVGCSGVKVVAPPDAATIPKEGSQSLSNHSLWGLWQGVIDQSTEMIEFTQLRTSAFHLNALPFL